MIDAALLELAARFRIELDADLLTPALTERQGLAHDASQSGRGDRRDKLRGPTNHRQFLLSD
jgi:hypothetical protein